jgi:NADH dehydrogenase (ubiquinone) 1 alpha subcomplex subunit 9
VVVLQVNVASQDKATRHFSMADVNVDGARIVARAAAEAGVARLIHVSALGADVDSPSEYLRTKALGVSLYRMLQC